MAQDELLDAAVAIVRKRAEQALQIRNGSGEYTEAFQVAIDLETPEPTAKIKRLLDRAASQPDPPILRFSSRDHSSLPRLDGTMRRLYGNAVGYTTPEVYEAAQQAVAHRRQRERAEGAEMDALLQRARKVGLPPPRQHTRDTVTYDKGGLRALLRAIPEVE